MTRSGPAALAASCFGATTAMTRSAGSSAAIRSVAAVGPTCSRTFTGPGDDCNIVGDFLVLRERITDVNFDEDRFQVLHHVAFAANVAGVNAPNLEIAAGEAIQLTVGIAGGGPWHVAAQFSFGGRQYLAIDQGGANGWFTEADDLLIDITGATGTIGSNDFFV